MGVFPLPVLLIWHRDRSALRPDPPQAVAGQAMFQLLKVPIDKYKYININTDPPSGSGRTSNASATLSAAPGRPANSAVMGPAATSCQRGSTGRSTRYKSFGDESESLII